MTCKDFCNFSQKNECNYMKTCIYTFLKYQYDTVVQVQNKY